MLLARLGTPAPIRYVQDAILNLRHPYIGVATATPDIYIPINSTLPAVRLGGLATARPIIYMFVRTSFWPPGGPALRANVKLAGLHMRTWFGSLHLYS